MLFLEASDKREKTFGDFRKNGKESYGDRILMLIAGLLALMDWRGFPVSAEDAVRPEVRALWVDAFNDGIKTPAQVDQLIHDSLIAGATINTLIVQVRRRGDAYYGTSASNRDRGTPDLLPGFDALQYLIEQAHANRIEVHAYLNTLVARHQDETAHKETQSCLKSSWTETVR